MSNLTIQEIQDIIALLEDGVRNFETATYEWGSSWKQATLDIAAREEETRVLVERLKAITVQQGGMCWACGEHGENLVWWYVALYAENGTMNRSERRSYLIHPSCTQRAEEKVSSHESSRPDDRH